jgi:predicted permease
MRVARRFANAVRNLVRRREVDRDLDAELQASIDLIADERIAAGMSEADARRAARLELGGVEQIRTRVRETRAGSGIDRWSQDLRGAVRWMRHRPGFAITTIVILSIGIGAVTAVFAVASTILFSPPGAIPSSDRLVALDRVQENRPWAPITISWAEYLEYARRSDLFTAAASQRRPAVVQVGDRTERVAAELATANYFDVLGVGIQRGRSFSATADADEAIASDRFLRTFGIEGDGLGTVIRVAGQQLTIVGVVPAAFTGTEQLDRNADLWLPATARRRLNPFLSPERKNPLTDLDDRGWSVVARLHDGIDIASAQASLLTTSRDLQQRHPEALRGTSVEMREGLMLPSRQRFQVGVTMGLILMAVFLLLLIACANVANLTLARTLSRSKEIAIRLSLGASRRRVVRQLLTETLVLTVIASAGGALFARWLLAAISGVMPPDAELLLFGNVSIVDWRVGVFLFVATAIAAAAAGLVPAWQGTAVPVISAMKHGGPSGPKAKRTRIVFLTVQVALAVVLLTASGLLARALQAAYAYPLGFDSEGLLLASVDPPPRDHPLYRDLPVRVQAELTRQPELSLGSIAAQPPLKGGGAFVASFTRVPATASDDSHAKEDVLQNQVGPDYFGTIGLPIIAGRGIGAQDTAGSEPVIVINEALARTRWSGENPVGTSIRLSHERTPRTVVGVVAQAQHIGLTGRYGEGLYLPLTQSTSGLPTWTLLMRPRADLASAIQAAHRALRAAMPDYPLYEARWMDEQLAFVLSPQRTMAIVTGTFGLLALLLTAAGLAAAVSFVVAQRSHEIGVRMALGAQRPQVLALVLRQGLSVTAIGAVIGLGLSAVAVSLLGSMFVGFDVKDPVVPLATCALLALVTLLASIAPARRAARVDPLTSLRAE